MKLFVMFLHAYTAAIKVPCCGVDEPHAEEVPVARKTAAEGVEGASGRGVQRPNLAARFAFRRRRFLRWSRIDAVVKSHVRY